MNLLALSLLAATPQKDAPIDRHALVSRHNVVLTAFEGERPVQVGNGEFAFGMDITGLQTFVPFNTMSHWGYHNGPVPAGTKIEDFQGQVWDTHGRPVRYPMPDPSHPVISEWLAASPHAINLGRIGLILTKRDGSEAEVADLRNPKQTLDLWTGLVTSRFEIEGESVSVVTAADPKVDSVAARIESPLVKEGRLAVFLSCPGNNPAGFANFIGDWSRPGHFDLTSPPKSHSASFSRHMDELTYHVGLTWSGSVALQMPHYSGAKLELLKAEYGARDRWVDVTDSLRPLISNGELSVRATNDLTKEDPYLQVRKTLRVTYRISAVTKTAEVGENEDLRLDADPNRHRIVLRPAGSELAFSCTFAPAAFAKSLPDAGQVIEASRQGWPQYWKSGGAIDLSGSTDPRWKELERRLVLSQYLMKVNEAGSYPPQESGLVNNGWFGRWHMEMLWWHAAHWGLWNRWPEANPSLDIYNKLLATSTKLAKSEGYLGARWPKCIGPNLREWPHEIHALLIWQQPHPIFFAELDYRAHPTRQTLLKWKPVVDATADFMSSYAFFDRATNRYVLGPPLQVVSENATVKTALNPTFELGYWRFGLRTAQLWRERLDLARVPVWDKVLKGLSPLPTENGLYLLHEGVRDMWTKFNFEHPALTGAYGLLPGDGVNKASMRRTLDKVMATWDFNHTWGWDFPMLAMCAARLGEPDRAIDLLMHPAAGFQFDARGLATGGPFPYFPANGGLLYAVAMMAQGWDGSPKTQAPGFPKNGRWNVRYEGLAPAL